jgi:hypothetical protein
MHNGEIREYGATDNILSSSENAELLRYLQYV